MLNNYRFWLSIDEYKELACRFLFSDEVEVIVRRKCTIDKNMKFLAYLSNNNVIFNTINEIEDILLFLKYERNNISNENKENNIGKQDDLNDSNSNEINNENTIEKKKIRVDNTIYPIALSLNNAKNQ